jgi:hypothetical protein
MFFRYIVRPLLAIYRRKAQLFVTQRILCCIILNSILIHESNFANKNKRNKNKKSKKLNKNKKNIEIM